MKTEDLRKPIPATGTVFSAWAYFDFDKPATVAEAERLLRSHGYNTEIPGTIAEQAAWDSVPMLIWRVSSDCFDSCSSTNMLDEVERIVTPLDGHIPIGADLFDVSLLQDPANWQEEVYFQAPFFDPDFGRGAKPRVRH